MRRGVGGRLAGHDPWGWLGMRWIGASPQAKKRDSVSPAGLTTAPGLLPPRRPKLRSLRVKTTLAVFVRFIAASSPAAAFFSREDDCQGLRNAFPAHRSTTKPCTPSTTAPKRPIAPLQASFTAMDSMRSLNTSLPKTKRQPDVHQSFRTAALNVTNLYKSALADLDRARTDGYQEALDDLMAFLDKENIGMGAGEGHRIRQWAAERLDGSLPKHSGSDSDEEYLDDKRARSSSPIMERNLSLDEARTLDPAMDTAHRPDSAPPPLQMEASTTEADMSPLHHVFQFSAPQTFPTDSPNDNNAGDMSAAARRAFPNPRRPSNRSTSRNLQRSAAQNLFQLGNGAGQKRRLMNDFFNVDGPNDRRDGSSGGPKRGRMSTPLLEHTFLNRPPPSSILLPLYLAHPAPRPPLIYLPSTNPPTLLYSIIQDQLLFLCPSSADTDPLAVLSFLHRLTDVLEDFLGSPLLASKIEGNYDVVSQLLSEMVDGGIIANTEPNALRDVVEAPNLLKTLLGGVGLPSSTPSSLAPSSTGAFGLGGGRPSPRLGPTSSSNQTASPVPWRRANVRHTSNEMYVDIVETLQVTLSPSGRPLAAMANGTIAFTAKVSGVPDLILQLGCAGGIQNAVSLPVFHPCVRLNQWKARPGELSFVPPDGRFVLAGYEVDLLGSAALDSFSTDKAAKSAMPKLSIPATVSVHPSLGPTGTDFEVKLQLNPRFTGRSAASSSQSSAAKASLSRVSSSSTGTTAAPAIEEMLIHIPLPTTVKNVVDLRVARGMGDASYAPGDRAIEWRVSSREIGLLMSQDRGGGIGVTATLRGTVVGQDDPSADDALDAGGPVSFSTSTYDYDDDDPSTQPSSLPAPTPKAAKPDSDAKIKQANKVLMPSCATLSFSVKGWLPSGIKVESLNVDQRRSKGLGSGVTPYKGVKYLCVSREGVECRC
ncbi:clathrin adaptor, mu subunit [Stemphylium lycopersici]|uniref:Clathrin adaptor, mu subunit n=1 Tax=Stemphylium lycopersici TaxID=183478 RepID=A0A364MY43_STELY|nr:clathrin adaptor, mu subunit [Stemphylium lycopersici]